MVEAVRTTASPAAIWAICVVAVLCLAFWLFMINYADRHPYVRHRQPPDTPGPVLTRPEAVPAQRAAPGDTPAGNIGAEAPTEPIPAQRSADADQPRDTSTGGRS